MLDLGDVIANPRFDAVMLLAVATLCVTMFIAGFIRGFVGFGGALVAVPVFTVIFGPLIAVPLAAITGLASTIQLLPTAIRVSESAFVVPVGLATFVAAPLGTWLLVAIDPQLMKIAISVLVIAMVAVVARGAGELAASRRSVLVGAGLTAGFVQGVAGVGGPPMVAVALARGGPTPRQRANVLAAVTAVSFASMPPLWWHGLFTSQVLLAGMVLVPIYALGTWTGARFFSREGQRYFRTAALLVLVVIGVVTLSVSVHDYFTAS